MSEPRNDEGAPAAAGGGAIGAPAGAPEIVVQKYGGSSVADPERLARVAERVAATARAGYRVVVVVSAMGRATDELIALAKRVSKAPPRRELDMLVSTGERVSMALLAMALDGLGIEAISFTGSQSGIITNDRHSGARIVEVRPVRIEDELARGRVVIVAGFQGMSYRREITTLGRGGSDTTAVALAAALRATYCEICSDVDGVYTADPRVVPEARRLESVGYDEMQELAEHGAKVLHAQAVEWARRAGIVIHARATSSSPTDLAPGTRIEAAGGARRAVAVTGARRLVRVRAAAAAAAELAAGLREEGVALRRFAIAPGGDAEAVFAPDDVPDLSRVLERVGTRVAGARVDERGAVTIVGAGFGADAGDVGRAWEEALARGAEALDATPMRVTAWLDPERVDELVRAWHAAFLAA